MVTKIGAAVRALLDTVERKRERELFLERRRSQMQPVTGTGLSNAEQSVVIQVSQTLARADRKRARRLLRLQRVLVAAARDNLLAWHDVRAPHLEIGTTRAEIGHTPAKIGPVQAEVGPALDKIGPAPAEIGAGLADGQFDPLAPGPRTQDPSQPPGTGRRPYGFDPHRPLIGERSLLAAEAILLVVEVTFWYAVFAADVARDAPLLDTGRVSAALLAVFLPAAGLLAARVIGGLGHRWVAAYPGVGRRERLGTVFAGGLAAVAVGATVLLVHRRFDEEYAALGAMTVPAWPMAMIFGVMLLADIAARVFMTSEVRAQRREQARTLRRLRERAIRAQAAHVHAWLALRNETQVQLDRCERVVAVGATIINDARVAATGPVERSVHEQTRPAHRTDLVPDDDGHVPLALPNSAQLQMFGSPLTLGPLRCVDDAVNTLAHWRPRGHPAMIDDLDDILRQITGEPAEQPRRSPATTAIGAGLPTAAIAPTAADRG